MLLHAAACAQQQQLMLACRQCCAAPQHLQLHLQQQPVNCFARCAMAQQLAMKGHTTGN
jgi:hypothetical protein